MEVLAWAIDSDFVGCDSAQPVRDGRLPIRVLTTVTDHDTITGKTFAKVRKHSFEIFAADFFFSFDQKLDLQGKRFTCCQPVADALDVSE